MDEGTGFPDRDWPRVIETSNVDFAADFYNPLLTRAVSINVESAISPLDGLKVLLAVSSASLKMVELRSG